MKKNKTKTILIGLMLFLLISSGLTAFAASGTQTIPISYDNIKVYVNGTLTPMMTDGKAVEPFTYNGRTYVPLRAVSEALNQDVDWDGNTNSIRITSSTPSNTTTPIQNSNTANDQLEEIKLLHDINLVRRCADGIESHLNLTLSLFRMDSSQITSARLQDIVESQIQYEDLVDKLPQSFLFQSKMAYQTLDRLSDALMESRLAIAGYIQSYQTNKDAYDAWNIEFEARNSVQDILAEELNPLMYESINRLLE